MATPAPPDSRPKWGDADDEEFTGLPDPEVTEEKQADGTILRTIVEYRLNGNHKVKITKKVKLTPVKSRRWKKFGDCANLPAGPERGNTTIADEELIVPARRAETEEQKPKKGETSLGIVCRNCKGDHWTLKCPHQKMFAIPALSVDSEAAQAPLTSSGGGEGPGTKYVPPGARGTGGVPSRMPDSMRREETATVRVTNLSEETKESDLQELFRKFGPISRVFLAKDKVTGLSKGFAFINFMRRDDAQRAIDKLSGKFGYDHLILHIEWAKPSLSDNKRI